MMFIMLMSLFKNRSLPLVKEAACCCAKIEKLFYNTKCFFFVTLTYIIYLIKYQLVSIHILLRDAYEISSKRLRNDKIWRGKRGEFLLKMHYYEYNIFS